MWNDKELQSVSTPTRESTTIRILAISKHERLFGFLIGWQNFMLNELFVEKEQPRP